jgi:carbonic anhydrase/acetyltransferase-like protein (isoleucine patch superfamily)
VAIWALGDAVPSVHADAWVHPAAHLIGDVAVGEGASIWPGAVLRGDFGSIEIGAGSSVQDNCVVHAGNRWPTRIGRECVVGHAAYIEGAMVEEAVLVGSGSVLLPGSCVRTGGIVASGAVVLSGTEVRAGQRAQGVPARLVAHQRGEGEVREGAQTYRRLARRYARGLRRIDVEGVT